MSGKYPRYPAYKDSGVEWLGEVPEHWETVPCRVIVHERTEKNEGTKCENYLSLMANIGVIPYAEKGDIGNKKPDDLSKCKLVQRGDFVINSMNYGIGSYGLSSYSGVCSPVYIVLKPQSDVVHPQYASRIFENHNFQKFAQSFGNGILEHRCAINWDILKSIYVVLPHLTEQQAIATYLDIQTARIDALIAEYGKLITLLKEKRQALISHAVTKGLNPDAPMKDSGVEWLGEVPEHWEVVSLKQIVSTPITDGPHATPEFLDFGIPFISAEAVSDGTIDFEKKRGYISAADNDEFSKKYRPEVNDIYLVKSGASTGTTAIVDTDMVFNIWSPLAVIRCNDRSAPRFVLRFLRSRNFQNAITLNWSYGTQQNIGMGVIERLHFVRPPLPEQQAIAAFLDHETTRMDALIQQAESGIDLLKERRTTLISDAVTGKIDVRGIAA